MCYQPTSYPHPNVQMILAGAMPPAFLTPHTLKKKGVALRDGIYLP